MHRQTGLLGLLAALLTFVPVAPAAELSSPNTCVATFEGAGWLTVDLGRGPASLVIGNVAECDGAGLRVSLLDGEDGRELEVHNPSPETWTGNIRVPSWLVAATQEFARTVSVPAGRTETIPLF